VNIERDRQVRGAAASCLVAVVVYHDAGETPRAANALGAAVREVVARCGDGGMSPDEFVTSVLYPPLRGLVDLYGPVCGRELFTAFLLSRSAERITQFFGGGTRG
jgi:hypothetical protein